MSGTHITSVAFNCNDVSYKANVQTIDFVTSQITFEALTLVLHPFAYYISAISLIFLLELVLLKKIKLMFQVCASTNYKF